MHKENSEGLSMSESTRGSLTNNNPQIIKHMMSDKQQFNEKVAKLMIKIVASR